MRAAVRNIVLLPSDPDALQWREAVRTAGGAVSSGQLRFVTNLIKGLKADGVWPLHDRIVPYASENSTQARRDLVARVAVTPQNSPTFTANRGYQGDALSSYIDLNFNPSTAGGKYTRNDACYWAWIETANAAASARIMGNDGVNASELRIGGTNVVAGINSAVYTDSGKVKTSTGFFVVTRVGASGAGSQNTYYNGANLVADNQASTALPNQNFFSLASNQAGSAIGLSDARVAMVGMGGSLTAAQVAALYSRVRTYMTAVGVA